MRQELEIVDLREKYFKVSNQIFEEKLDIYEIGVYSVLCRFANNDSSESFPSITRIQEMLKVSRPKIVKTLKSLTEKGIIHKKSGNKGYSNRYYLMSLPSKRELLVNEINQPSKPQLPQVVNEVNSIKTNNKKTNNKDYTKENNILLANKEFNFIVAWKEWVAYRLSLKKKMTEITINKQLKMLSKQPNAVDVINQSIEKGWSGLFPIKEFNNYTPKPREHDARFKILGLQPNQYNDAYATIKKHHLQPNQLQSSLKPLMKREGYIK